jgi:hypothetical protein
MASKVGSAMTTLRDGDVYAAAASLRISLEPSPRITSSVERPWRLATSAASASACSSG